MKDLRKLFGTDGIRGVAGIDLTPGFVSKVGKAAAQLLWPAGDNRKKILVGRDTRPSGGFISEAVISAAIAGGVDVLDGGIMTTPEVALLINLLNLDGGIVISASHNPVEDNGIKFFTAGGIKLTDSQEKAIEDCIISDEQAIKKENTEDLKLYAGHDIGRLLSLDNANTLYRDYLKKIFKMSLAGLKVALDCANGAASMLAPFIFESFGATVIPFNCNISGEDINKNCGATHPEFISKATIEANADIGFSFDGDADRVMACDRKGRILDGDIIIGFCAIDMSRKKTLNNNCVVTTVMANMGFDKVMSSEGITVYKTDVGDRYVIEKMNETGAVLGGEQSGHIIFKNISPTGDGILSALEFLNVILSNNYDLDSINSIVPKFPQILKNIRVQDKKKLLESENLRVAIADADRRLDGKGRLLVRPSGTESLIRVMAEAQTLQLAENAVDQVVELILKEQENL